MQRTSKIEANQGTKTSQPEGREEGHGRLEHTTVGRAICVGENPSLEDLWRAYIQYEQIEENANAVKMLVGGTILSVSTDHTNKNNLKLGKPLAKLVR
jgi:hypothetical protein